jgi:hypothetical protein
MAGECIYKRPFNPGEDVDHFVRYYRALSELDLAPKVIAVTDYALVAVRHPTLEEWLTETARTSEELHEMGERLYHRVALLHSKAICHRDLHVENVVLRTGVPLFIDPAFAIDSDSAKPCYDLEGPGRSGVEVPAEHAGQGNGNELGVWWDSSGPVPTLGAAFGSLAEFEAG